MPDTDSITIVQKFTYRGQREEFSNTYHLDGTTPTNDAGWLTVANALWDLLKLLYTAEVTMVRAYGYEAGNEHAVYVHDYEATGPSSKAGAMSFTGPAAPGDAAMYCSWWTGARDSRGKKIYLRKYFHGVHSDAANPDKVDPAQLVKLGDFATALLTAPISGDLKLVGPQGAVPVNARASTWITTRTLKRRGRRPPG